MTRKSCNPCPPSPPDNCYAECVKCCVEKCKKLCCERKYLRLAHRLLDNGLFIDNANYVKAQVHSARTDSQFNNIVNAFADPVVTDVELQPGQPIIVNNQPNNLLSFESLGFDAINVLEFTLAQLTSFSFLGGDFTFIMQPVLSLLFGIDITAPEYSTLSAAISTASPTLTSSGSPTLLAFLLSYQAAVGKVLRDVIPGGLTQVILGSDTPYVTNVEFLLQDPSDSLKPTVVFVGKAALVSKVLNVSSPITAENAYFLAISARRIVDRHGPLPGPCDE